MAVRFYIVPKEFDGFAIKPKYFGNDTIWTALNYQSDVDSSMLVRCDTTDEQHAAVVANADALALPTNMQKAVGAKNLAKLQAGLKQKDIPSDWIAADTTYAEVLREVVKLFTVARRMQGRFNMRLLPKGASLDRAMSDMPNEYQQALSAVAAELGSSTARVSAGSTLRQTLRQISQQSETPLRFGGQEL